MRLPKTILVNENETAEERANRIAADYELLASDHEKLEKRYQRLRKYLARVRERTSSMAGYRCYRMFMALMDGLAFNGQFNPDTLAKAGGQKRVDMLISHAASLAVQAYKEYSRVTREKYLELTMRDAVVSPKGKYDAAQYENDNEQS